MKTLLIVESVLLVIALAGFYELRMTVRELERGVVSLCTEVGSNRFRIGANADNDQWLQQMHLAVYHRRGSVPSATDDIEKRSGEVDRYREACERREFEF